MSAPVELRRSRLARLTSAVGQSPVDALVVSHLPNLRYLFGVTASAGLAVIARDRVTLLADERYREAFTHAVAGLPEVSVVAVAVGSSHEERLAAVVAELSLHAVGVEAGALTLSRASAIRRHLGSNRAELVETDGMVELLRMVKDPWEQAIFREAGARLTAVAACILPKVLAGRPEREVAWDIDVTLRAGGFERPAFETIVASGANGARPHHRASDRRIDAGDLVVVDFGGVLDGYAVDMTRTVAVGTYHATAGNGWRRSPLRSASPLRRSRRACCRHGLTRPPVTTCSRRVWGNGSSTARGMAWASKCTSDR